MDMKEIITIIGNATTGVFALLAAYFAWRLKRGTDDRDRKTALAVERRKDLQELFSEVFAHLEQAIQRGQRLESFDLTLDLSRVNAKIRLIASEEVNLAYDDAADKLHEWSLLHVKASPRQMKVGESTIAIIQAPDPTAAFKKPAAEAYEALHASLDKLRKCMRSEIERAGS